MEWQGTDHRMERLALKHHISTQAIAVTGTEHSLNSVPVANHVPDPSARLDIAGILCLLLVLCVFSAGTAQAQVADTSKLQLETPVMTLQKFKAALDKTDYPSICRMMAEEDASGPLKAVHYEQMQRSIEGLVNMWRGMPFQYVTTTIRTEGTPPACTIHVNVLNLRQEVKFVLLKFGRSWYVFDIEIYFK